MIERYRAGKGTLAGSRPRAVFVDDLRGYRRSQGGSRATMAALTVLHLPPLPVAKSKRTIPDGFSFECFDRNDCPNSVDCLYGGCAKGNVVVGGAFFVNTSDLGRDPRSPFEDQSRRPAYFAFELGGSDRTHAKGTTMSVLRYGFPQTDALRCDHPVCNNFASHRLLLLAQVAGGTERETFACDDHAAQLQIGSKLIRDERLKKEGERNVPLAEIKK